MTPSCEDEPQIEGRIAHDYYCRFHMGLILAAVMSSGVLASKGLLELGVPLRARYPIAVLASYGIFLLLIRIWIWYVSGRHFRLGRGNGFSGPWNLGGGSGGGGGVGGSGRGFAGFGGGSSGGGGATSSWDSDGAPVVVVPPVSAPSGGGHWWSGSFGGGGGDNDGWLVIVILGALIACILGGGVYLIVVAPHIMPEAAAQVLLAGTLTRVSKEHHHNWMAGVVKSTWIPFVIVLVLASALGWAAHRACPSARRLIDVFHCQASGSAACKDDIYKAVEGQLRVPKGELRSPDKLKHVPLSARQSSWDKLQLVLDASPDSSRSEGSPHPPIIT